MPELTVKRGPDEGQKFSLTNFPVSIGRAWENSVALTDPEISRFHVRIKKRGRLLILEDLDSKNGCYLNGERVVNTIIQHGDRILIGNTELLLALPSELVDFAAKKSIDLSMVIDQQQGISGPIDIALEQAYTPAMEVLGVQQASILNRLGENVHSMRKIYDLQGNVMVTNHLEEACQVLLKSLNHLCPLISRGAAFLWSSSHHQLIPTATKSFLPKDKEPFRINQRVLSETLGLKQGLLIREQDTASRGKYQHRIILPLLHHQQILGVLHLEADQPLKKFPLDQLEDLQTLIYRCAPSFETKLLRMEIDDLMVGMIETVVATIEAKDTYTVGHSERVCKFSMAIADELKLNKEVKRMLMISSICHDIGKIGIPDHILKKASLLSREEYEEMQLHPTIGANIIAHIPNAKKFLSGVKYHHEKWDGTGYPEGLVGENIPFFGRIVGVADVFDAMVSGRSYSGFIDESDAITKIQSEAELFDPEILKALVRAWEQGAITQRTSTHNEPSSPEPGSKADPKEVLRTKPGHKK